MAELGLLSQNNTRSERSYLRETEDGTPPLMLIVRFIPKNCVACKSCELACALHHSSSGDINKAMTECPSPTPRLAIGFKDGKLHLTRCLHCKKPECVEACDTGAITKGEDGAVTIRQEKCTGCFKCIEMCPFGAIQSWDHKAVKCDLCNGATELSCVTACKCGALVYGQKA
ncbi:MAG: 4Fe-4S dicluster domain-containing protein [Halobacteriota archaeon]